MAGIIEPSLREDDPESQPNMNDAMTLWTSETGRNKLISDLQKVFQTNYLGPHFLSVSAAEKMKARALL